MIIDLSIPLYQSMPVFPGDREVTFEQRLYHEDGGFNVHYLSMGTHVGTHIDAPYHTCPEGKTVDTAAVLNACVGEALVLDISQGFEESEILPSHIEPYLPDIHKGDRVLLSTGWISRFGGEGFFTNFPSLSEEAADIFVERKIALIGLDTPSVHVTKDRIVHTKLLSAGIVIVENLANLTSLRENRVFFAAAPLRLEGLDGSPVRAYAIVPDR